MGRKHKTGLTKNPLFYEKTKERMHCLSRLAITFYQTSKVVFIQGKLDFTSGLDPSYKDDILTQGDYSPNTKE
jgi:peptide/nickel transport system substrate-binding protein